MSDVTIFGKGNMGTAIAGVLSQGGATVTQTFGLTLAELQTRMDIELHALQNGTADPAADLSTSRASSRPPTTERHQR